jgi:hypothetical protein
MNKIDRFISECTEVSKVQIHKDVGEISVSYTFNKSKFAELLLEEAISIANETRTHYARMVKICDPGFSKEMFTCGTESADYIIKGIEKLKNGG